MRNTLKLFKIVSVCMLICISFLVKGLFVYMTCFDFFFINESLMEYITYVINGALLFTAFVTVEKYLNSYVVKGLSTLLTSAGFIFCITIENYFYQSFKYVKFGWYDWDFFFFARKGINHYLSTGEPGYHWAFLTMLAICILTIIIHAKTKEIIFPIKKWLVEKAISTRKSIYFDLTLRDLRPYIAILDYLELRDVYLNEEIKCSFFHEEITEDEFNDIELLLDYKLKRSALIYRDIFNDVSLEVSENTSDVDTNGPSSDDNKNDNDA